MPTVQELQQTFDSIKNNDSLPGYTRSSQRSRGDKNFTYKAWIAPLAILLVLVAIRPKFIYTIIPPSIEDIEKGNDKERKKINYSKAAFIVVVLSVIINAIYYYFKGNLDLY